MIGVIDVGSNSIRLMLTSDMEHALDKRLSVARLGEGLAINGYLKADRMRVATDIIAHYVSEAKNAGATAVYVYATEAVRSAVNGNDFVNMVREKTGIDIDVLPSNIEAKLAFSGAYNGVGTIAIVDIGGASTEITIGNNDGIVYSKSLPIGCVRMRDKCGEDDAILNAYIEDTISQYGEMPSVESVTFVAGSASIVVTMAMEMDIYDAKLVDGKYMDRATILRLIRLIKDTPMSERADIKGLPANKIDTAYQGMTLIVHILDMLGFDGFTFSDRDGLEGYAKYLKSKL